MYTALIIARFNSTRLKAKHTYSIDGDKDLMNFNISILKKNKNINEIFISTGTYKNNNAYEKYANKFVKIFYHKNEDNVTERIYFNLKKVRNENILFISGDCPITDEGFIKRLTSKYEENYAMPEKNNCYEGIWSFKKNYWEKVFLYSNKYRHMEHPGLIIKESFKDRYFKVKLNKLEKKLKIRASIDYYSDYIFFKTLFFTLRKKQKKISIKNIYNLKKSYSSLFKINKSITQRTTKNIKNKNILILTAGNRTVGYGHITRMQVLRNEIIKRENINVDIRYFETDKKFQQFENLESFSIIKEKIKLYKYIIVDLPISIFKNFRKEFVLYKKKIILYDFTDNDFKSLPIKLTKRKKTINIKNIILTDYLKYLKIIKNKKTIDLLISSGGSDNIKLENINSIIECNKNKNIVIINNNLKYKNLKYYESNIKIKKFKTHEVFLELISKTKTHYCRYGHTFFESIFMGVDTVLFDYNKSDKKIIDKFNFPLFNSKRPKNNYKFQSTKEIIDSLNL